MRVTDYFSWTGNEYLVMDFVEGGSLADLIEREGAQPEERVVSWARQLLDALAYCHGQGVLHRDIKPQNIVITPEGQAVLVDFGLVKLWDPGDPQTRTVMRGAGTPEYAPPEQYDLGIGHTDPRSDVYSLGATLYHSLTGQTPPTATQRMATPDSFVPPSTVNASVNPATETAVLKALQIPMEHRFQSATEMTQALGASPRGVYVTPSRSRPEDGQTTPAITTEPPAKPKRGLLMGLGGVGIALVGVLCLALAAGAVIIGVLLLGNDTDGEATLDRTPGPLLATSTLMPGESGVLFEDDFESTSSGWEVGEYDMGSVGYEAGTYAVVSAGNNATMWGVANQYFENVVIEVDATQVLAGPENDNDYGVMCRTQETGDGYHLLISGDGFYAIGKAQDGEFDWLAEWTESDAIQQGNATNHIQAICDGTTLTLFVNGQRLATAADDTFTRGDVALTATSYEDTSTEIRFDNLTVNIP